MRLGTRDGNRGHICFCVTQITTCTTAHLQWFLHWWVGRTGFADEAQTSESFRQRILSAGKVFCGTVSWSTGKVPFPPVLRPSTLLGALEGFDSPHLPLSSGGENRAHPITAGVWDENQDENHFTNLAPGQHPGVWHPAPVFFHSTRSLCTEFRSCKSRISWIYKIES